MGFLYNKYGVNFLEKLFRVYGFQVCKVESMGG